MAGARNGAGAALTIPTGVFGGSFNPAHAGHRRVTLAAARALGLRDVWWLVSPGNPLKENAHDMAPLAARLASARSMARRTRIVPTAIEASLGTRYTIDTVRKLVRRYPRRRFVWIMGADALAEFDRWRDWRGIARIVPIAVIARPGYDTAALRSGAMAWLGRFVRPASQARCWTMWSPPALVLLRFRPDPHSATQMRALRPDWSLSMPTATPRDRLTRRSLS